METGQCRVECDGVAELLLGCFLKLLAHHEASGDETGTGRAGRERVDFADDIDGVFKLAAMDVTEREDPGDFEGARTGRILEFLDPGDGLSHAIVGVIAAGEQQGALSELGEIGAAVR